MFVIVSVDAVIGIDVFGPYDTKEQAREYVRRWIEMAFEGNPHYQNALKVYYDNPQKTGWEFCHDPLVWVQVEEVNSTPFDG